VRAHLGSYIMVAATLRVAHPERDLKIILVKEGGG
jgi:hypothetical protein